MLFVNVRELHDQTSAILREVAGGHPIFITKHGKPVAVIRGLTEEDLEDFVLLHHPQFRKDLEEALDDVEVGRTISLREAISRAKAELGHPVNPQS